MCARSVGDRTVSIEERQAAGIKGSGAGLSGGMAERYSGWSADRIRTTGEGLYADEFGGDGVEEQGQENESHRCGFYRAEMIRRPQKGRCKRRPEPGKSSGADTSR